MKKLAATVALILLLLSSTSYPASPARRETIEQLVEKLSVAYDAKALRRLDRSRPFQGRVRIEIEHSLNEDHREVKQFRTLAEGDRWLRSMEREDGTPFRETRPLLQCRRGVCTFNFDGGILHNHLYLHKITYGYRNGSPYIKTIFLLDGD